MSFEFQFKKLKPLCSSIRKNNKSIEQFNITYNRVEFDCIIDIDANPFELMIGAIGLNFSCILYVHPGFITEMDDEDFYKLRDILNLESSDSHFNSFAFLKYLDEHFPPSSSPELVEVEHLLPYRANKLTDKEREEGFIFAGWLPHQGKNNGHVRNINKTRQLLGEKAAQYCEKNDISSKWTTDERLATRLTQPWV